ncbi:hypothetical protein [Rubritalea profundi]|nr:hypothetical protein [Rubritalea profundi]
MRSGITGLETARFFATWARLAVVPLLCSSCTVLKYKIGGESIGNLAQPNDLKIQQVPQIPSTRSEILDQLGPPEKVGQLESGHYVFAYEFRDVVERQIGLSIPNFSLFKLSLGKARADRYALLIELNEHNKLHSAGYSHWIEDVGYGVNIQLFLAVTPTTDTKALREQLDTEVWTTRLLSSPVGLVDLTHNSDLTGSGLYFSGMPNPSLQWPTNNRKR